jgi:predicted nucleic acid-binding protein
MSRYVIDPVTLLHLVDNDLAVDPSHQLVAPNALRSEAMQLLFDDVRRGVRSERDALHVHDRITELKMRLLGDRVSRRTAWQIARAQGWASLGECEYFAVTRLQADAFVTVDAALARRASEVVAVAPLDALTAPTKS